MNIMQNPQAIMLAILFGTVPALLWLWFWLKEDKEDPEPNGLLALCFLVGMGLVMLVIPIEKLIQSVVSGNEFQIIGWAAAEELIKFIAVLAILYRTDYVHKPLDWPIFLITTALGFAAL